MHYFDKLDEMIADKRIDNLKSGKTTVVPLEEVFKKAGLLTEKRSIKPSYKPHNEHSLSLDDCR